MARQISVIGGADCDAATAEVAYAVGHLVAVRGWAVVTGGLGGVMAAACRGAVDAGGLTIGILPTYNAASANPYVKVIIPSGLGYARNAVVVAAGEGVIAVGGRYGTLSEVALALNFGRPVVAIGPWSGVAGVTAAVDAEGAVAALAALLA